MSQSPRMTFLDRADAAWARLLTALALLACALVALMVAVICADVLVRNARLGNLPWATEVAEYTLYLSTFLATPWLLRQGAHVRMDMVLKALPPATAWALELVTDAIAVATCAALTLASANAALASAAQGSLVFKIFVYPEWWLITPASVLFGVLTIECLWRMRRQWTGPKTVREEATSVA
ncbi:TRAP transporter small permease [Ramlibacter sp. MAHUQ-53]|uniref:TRAP transporter small permease n=1 Tax=unclassified Ramlibacter TaxID=2617605 RepID=UPI003638E9AF